MPHNGDSRGTFFVILTAKCIFCFLRKAPEIYGIFIDLILCSKGISNSKNMYVFPKGT